ncbi:hypothetical protein [Actinomyces sp. ICM54]|uniref:hypothetical protein n=1 Tax=Actinomyces sp. ICM54 TaxID=936549 RepID=UPI0012EB45E6|nr:hypothetical protein [Actinomyces sp. ICM54]
MWLSGRYHPGQAPDNVVEQPIPPGTAQNADHFAISSPFSAFFTEVVCVLGATLPRTAAAPPPIWGNCAMQGCDTPATRRQRASHGAKPPSQPPEGRRIAYKTWPQHRLPRKNSPSTAHPPAFPRKNSPSKHKNAEFGVFWARRANFVALTPTIRPSRANYFAHKARQRGDIETNNTTARPQQGTAETGITTATEKCTKKHPFLTRKGDTGFS